LVAAASCRKSPATSASPEAGSHSSDSASSMPANRHDMALIKGGTFLMGTNDGMPYEAPVHEVAVNSFWMDEHEVTLAEFAKFVTATGYRTDAEKFGWSGVFDLKT